MVNINIQIPDETHKKIKVACAIRGISLKDFVIESLDNNLQEHDKPHKDRQTQKR